MRPGSRAVINGVTTFPDSIRSAPANSAPGVIVRMAIRNEDWAAIDKRIADAAKAAVAPLKPQGLKKVMAGVREVGTIGTVIGLFLALVAITLGSLYQSFGHVEKEATFRTETKDTLDHINDHLKKIESTLSTIQLTSAASDPVNPKNALEAKRLVTVAHQNSVQLPSAVIQENGQKFIEASEKSPVAWDTALAFLDYKSFVNTLAINLPTIKPDASRATTHVTTDHPPGLKNPNFFWVGTAPREQAAQVMKIGKDLDAEQALGVAFLFGYGGGMILDGMQLRNVVFQEVHIVYSGGPLKMTNVFFLNCTFEMKPDTNTLKLASAALTPGPAISFAAGL
jgi:hypothetical protein